jgi:hypothetical protein
MIFGLFYEGPFEAIAAGYCGGILMADFKPVKRKKDRNFKISVLELINQYQPFTIIADT